MHLDYNLQNVINWSSTTNEILKQFESKKNTGLVIYFHGHAILFQKMEYMSKSKIDHENNFNESKNSVRFDINTQNQIIIPSHNLIISKYLIDLRSDEFEEIPINVFVSYNPECKDLEFTSSRQPLTWNEICDMERRNYDRNTINNIKNYLVNPEKKIGKTESHEFIPKIVMPDTESSTSKIISQSFAPYTAKVYNDAKLFCKYLSKMLPAKAKILDLGGSNEPWFSQLCAENGLQVITFDPLEPSEPETIKKNGMTYIQDDINNLSNYKELLSDLDFIFCRHLSPAQRFWDWYDPNFIKIWKTMFEFIKETGIIYWVQMSNSTGIADTFFRNHETKYFKEFFDNLGLSVDITKYGYVAIKVMKNPKKLSDFWFTKKIFDPNLEQQKNKKDLYSEKDYSSLFKSYALQLQFFYESNDYDIDLEIKITGNTICSKITQILLEDNFRYKNVTIAGTSDKTEIQVIGDAKLSKFTLTDMGYDQNDYYIVDEPTDKRMTGEFITMLNHFQLYKLSKKHPKLLDIKKKYFKWIKF